MRDTIRVVEESYKEFILGKVLMPPRQTILIPEYQGWVGVMAGYIQGMHALATKIVTDFPVNSQLPTISGVIVLNDPKTGQPLSIMDGGLVTAMRTGAVGAIAAKYLSRLDTDTVGVFGAGVQARTQLAGVCEVRKVRRAKVYDISKERMDLFAAEMSRRLGIDVKVSDPKNVVNNSDVIATATTSDTPVFSGKWVEDGTHVSAMGAHSPTAREIDTLTIKDSKVVVDSIDSALQEVGEIIIPISERAITKSHIYAQLGELVAGIKPGRTSEKEKTVFKSCGLAIQDVSTAKLVYSEAIRRGFGKEVKLF